MRKVAYQELSVEKFSKYGTFKNLINPEGEKLERPADFTASIQLDTFCLPPLLFVREKRKRTRYRRDGVPHNSGSSISAWTETCSYMSPPPSLP
jgi:hypothetical protein